MSSSTKSKMPIAHILFLVAGITLIIYYLLSEGVPSLGNNIASIMKFVVEVFILILLVGFYFYFLFAKPLSGSISAIAPSLLILIIVGPYALNFGSNEANSIISGIAKMFYVLLIACGFVFLFVHNKLIGYVFSFSAVIFAAFVTLSYTIVMIMGLVNDGSFNVNKFFETLFYVISLGLLFVGGYRISKSKSWSLD